MGKDVIKKRWGSDNLSSPKKKITIDDPAVEKRGKCEEEEKGFGEGKSTKSGGSCLNQHCRRSFTRATPHGCT